MSLTIKLPIVTEAMMASQGQSVVEPCSDEQDTVYSAPAVYLVDQHDMRLARR